MKNNLTIPSRDNVLWLFLVALAVGIFLWIYSDPPPYGYSRNELSNSYWGVIIDIAHKWRGMRFTFWDKSVFGGTSLYTSGQYPILNPTNALCFVFNDNNFYLAKLIEPYVLGVFFMLILLRRQYRLSLPVSIFGSFLYMGLILSRHTIMCESPFFLWGIALFPLMVYVMERYVVRDIFLSAALVGALIALMFAGEGVIQVPQLLIWWSLFYFLYCRRDFLVKPVGRLKKWVGCTCLLVIMGIGIFGAQFIPTYEFAKAESISRSGWYDINNFPLWDNAAGWVYGGHWKTGRPFSLWNVVRQAFLEPGGKSGLGFVVLLLGVILLIILWPQKAKKAFMSFYHLPTIWLSTIIFLCLPSLAKTICIGLPFLNKIFSIFSSFTFRYGVHILDFCFVTTFCLFLDQKEITLAGIKGSKWKMIVTVFFVSLAIAFITLPTVLGVFGKESTVILSRANFLSGLIPSSLAIALIVFLLSAASLLLLLVRPRNHAIRFLLWLSLIALGFMTIITSYNFNDKGRRTHFEKYRWDSPEQIYFRGARGKYFFAFNPTDLEIDNYPLLHNVYSLYGYMPLRPRRVLEFSKKRGCLDPTKGPPNYFPIDFTMIEKNGELFWEDFQLKVAGSDYSVYERRTDPPRVFFSSALAVSPNIEKLILEAFTPPIPNKFYVLKDDIPYLKNGKMELSQDAAKKSLYRDFTETRQGFVRFTSITSAETFVMVPEMFQGGWRVDIDGQRTHIFPANFLFIGFRLPPGEHLIEMKFIPPKIFLGLWINLLSAGLLIYLICRYRMKGRTDRQNSQSLINYY